MSRVSKRTRSAERPVEIDADAVLAAVRAAPASLCVEIARTLNSTPARVGVLLKELRAAGRVTSEGRTRGTRWTAT